MKNRKPLTPEQAAKAAERKAAFRALWKQVAAMPEGERIRLACASGSITTCEGRALSLNNSCLLALQNPRVSVVGGFRQWIKQGRAVRKGERGACIWIPLMNRSEFGELPAESVEAMEKRFGTATVFDIAQTVELGAETEGAE